MSRAFHQWMGEIGKGDLHPGGSDATRTALVWLGPADGRTILEIGAGIGNTSARLRDAGWRVTALEPDPILRASLTRVNGIEVLTMPIERLPPRRFDAMVAESVLYALDLPTLFPTLRGRLEPGGPLAFCDMVWTPRASEAEASRLHDATLQSFGIACASRRRWTWPDWQKMLDSSGFSIERETCLGAGSPGRHSEPSRPPPLVQTLATWPARVRHRLAARQLRSPPGWLESWLCLARAR